jgi:hypothetical protein
MPAPRGRRRRRTRTRQRPRPPCLPRRSHRSRRRARWRAAGCRRIGTGVTLRQFSAAPSVPAVGPGKTGKAVIHQRASLAASVRGIICLRVTARKNSASDCGVRTQPAAAARAMISIVVARCAAAWRVGGIDPHIAVQHKALRPFTRSSWRARYRRVHSGRNVSSQAASRA